MSDPEYQDVLEVVSGGPVEDRIALARDVLETVYHPARSNPAERPSFEQAHGLASGDGRPPPDEQVAHWIDGNRMNQP